MEMILYILSWIAIITGSVFCVIGAIGLIRLPDVYCRMHAAGIIDTVGIGLIFLGLAFQAGWTLVLAKLAMILVFILFTSPTSCHALCRAAAYSGVHPMHGEQAPDGADVIDGEEDASLKT